MTGVQTCALPICFPVTIEFETLTTDYVVNKKGVRRSVSMSDAYYSQFAVRFTGSPWFNAAETSTLFRSVVYVIILLFLYYGMMIDVNTLVV